MSEHFLEHFDTSDTPEEEGMTQPAHPEHQEGGAERVRPLHEAATGFLGRVRSIFTGEGMGSGKERRAPRAAGALFCAALAGGCASTPGGASDRDVERVLSDATVEHVQPNGREKVKARLKAAGTVADTIGGVIVAGPAALALEPLMIARQYHEAQTAARALEAFAAAQAAGGGEFTIERTDGNERYKLAPYAGQVTDFAQIEKQHDRDMQAHDAWTALQDKHDWEHPAPEPEFVDPESLGLNVEKCVTDDGTLSAPVETSARVDVETLAGGNLVSFLDENGTLAFAELQRAIRAGCLTNGDMNYTIELVHKDPVPSHHEQFGQ